MHGRILVSFVLKSSESRSKDLQAWLHAGNILSRIQAQRFESSAQLTLVLELPEALKSMRPLSQVVLFAIR